MVERICASREDWEESGKTWSVRGGAPTHALPVSQYWMLRSWLTL